MRQNQLALLITLAAVSLPAQPQVIPASSPTVADAVARAFEEARSHAHLRKLLRIRDRPALRQIVCTAAVRGLPLDTVLAKESQADGAVLAVADTSNLPPEIGRIAEYDDRNSARGRRIARYSVAAFTSPSDPSLTWVGVALYWGRTTEYIALHLTRSYYPPDLRFDLVPACRSVS